MDIHRSARKHGIAGDEMLHAVEHALVEAEEADGAKVLYLGPDRAGNLLEVVAVIRDDGSELIIHAMRMRPIYESYLREIEDTDG